MAHLQTQNKFDKNNNKYITDRMNSVQERARQRNITPNFLRFKRKSSIGPNDKKGSEEDKIETQILTERSSSKASRTSFEAYDRRILHLSKLKNQVNQKNKPQQSTQNGSVRKINVITSQIKAKLRQSSSQRTNAETQRQNSMSNNTLIMQKIVENKKRNSASGKILNRNTKSPSNPKRSEQSLQKEDERAKLMNAQLMNNMLKNQFAPNYMNKLKMKKLQTVQDRKKPSKSKLLNLNVVVKGEEQMAHYEIFGELGKGAYGIVRMGVDKRTNEKIAIKIYEKKRLDEPNKIKNLQRQINILAELSNPTIAKLTDVIETTTQLYLILEYGGANSLYNYLLSKPEHRLSQTEAKKFLLVIAEALLYLHNLEIVHRDIKAENILINRHKQLKLIDFGFSLRCKANNTIDTFCGTPTYMAPQIVSKMDHCPIYTDMWSLGILFYVMLQGNYPFRAKNENDLFQKIKKGSFLYIYDDISKESQKLIESLLRVNPLQRLTIHEVLSKENRKWLAQEP